MTEVAYESDSTYEPGTLEDLVAFFASLIGVSLLFFACVALIYSRESIVLYREPLFLLYQVTLLSFVIWYSIRFCRGKNVSLLKRFGLDFRLERRISIVPYLLAAVVVSVLHVTVSFSLDNRANLLLSRIEWDELVRVGSKLISIAGLSSILVGPLTEESVYRGFTYPILKKKLGVWRGIAVTSALFAVMHSPKGSDILTCLYPYFFYFVLGVIVNVLFEKEKSLLWCICVHSLVNLLILSMSYLASP